MRSRPGQHNPAHLHEESLEQRSTTIMHLSGAVDIKTRMSEMRGAARRALDGARARVVDAASVARCPPPAPSPCRARKPPPPRKVRRDDPRRQRGRGGHHLRHLLTLNIYNTLLAGRLILTWFPNPPGQIVYPSRALRPVPQPVPRDHPPIGGTIDQNPILAFTVLNVFTNTAAAPVRDRPGDGRDEGAGERGGSA